MILAFIVVTSDFYDRYVKHKADLDVWKTKQIEQKKIYIRQTKTHHKRIQPILRSLLILVDCQLKQSVREPLEYLIYHKERKDNKDIWVPVAEYDGLTKYAFSFPYSEVWFQQTIRRNEITTTLIDNQMIDLFIDESQRQAFENVKVALVAPIYKFKSEKLPNDTVGMLVMYSSAFSNQHFLASDETCSCAKQVNERISMVLSYDYMTSDKV